jgi:acyl-CoA thioester hydrolase
MGTKNDGAIGMNSTDQPQLFWCEEKLRNADTDQNGHINNAVMASFFEAGRMEVLGDPSIIDLSSQFTFVVVRLEIDYKKELFYPGVVKIGSRITKVGNTSFHFDQTLMHGDVEVAHALAICVLVSKEGHQPVPIPDRLRAFFQGRV